MQQIDEIRIYAEVLEQGIDFKEYIRKSGYNGPLINVYTKKAWGAFSAKDSLIDRIRKVKDVDVLISAVSQQEEVPLLLIEYSTAVPTDDHKMQRSDVYYWSAIFKAPMMKISPSSKGMDQSFGGGSNFTDEFEIQSAYNHGAILYQIKWDTVDGYDVLPTKRNALSCIDYSEDIQKIITKSLTVFNDSDSFEKYYDNLLVDYYKQNKDVLDAYSTESAKTYIKNSTRFHWYNEKLSVKINRFGHAMDPDRGVLYFVNMLVGAENTITEIQVNRPSEYNSRGGYKSLFDRVAKSPILEKYVKGIIDKRGNKFTDEDAIYIFKTALNVENALSFKTIAPHRYCIEPDALRTFLLNHPSMTVKSIFFLSTELRLTDVDRNTICSVTWDVEPIKEYLSSVCTNNHVPITIKPLKIEDAKEDIITFASVELYKKIQCDLLAVSYPGAQGDRCVLTGSGRNVLRTYIDIIAYKGNNNSTKVYLEECKDDISKSPSDANKLCDICDDEEKRNGLALLFQKTIGPVSITNVYKAVGAKNTKNIPLMDMDVDYIFLFDIKEKDDDTCIDYSIAIINTEMLGEFMPLSEDGKRLSGHLTVDKIYIID